MLQNMSNILDRTCWSCFFFFLRRGTSTYPTTGCPLKKHEGGSHCPRARNWTASAGDIVGNGRRAEVGLARLKSAFFFVT
ncbi:uncharacterized protein TEOVI_000021600 [Trypanosoma equiperdum]|uniref:Uncharacterized protein n=1 Tax=Trypanosoma equiperdum TaxID=5694 RepID=A0A1G4I1Z7_TRYEQ|nr:hypothetical protein, conserved [Trypanosoma equiperdum]